MATTIVTKYGGDAPAASDIVRGELAVDTENGRLYTENAAGAVVEIGLNPEGNVDVTGSVTASGIDINGAAPYIKFLDTSGDAYAKIDADSPDEGTIRIQADPSNSGANSIIRFDVDGSERMRIDGSGNVGIGSGSPSYPLDVQSGTADSNIAHFTGANSTRGMTISTYTADAFADAGVDLYGLRELRFSTNATERLRINSDGSLVLNNAGGDAQMYFGGTSGTNRMYIARSGSDSLFWNVSNGVMRFGTNNAESMRIDASGNLLVGKTSDDFATAGAAISQAGEIQITRASATPLYVRRNTNDGELIGFYKDGTTVGSIGANNGVIYFAGPSANAGGFRIDSTGSNGAIIPTTNTGANRDAAVDLGYSSGGTNIRFRDLYLSGEIYNTAAYNQTTGLAANMYVNSAGRFFRSTSSERYKNTIQDATHGLTELLTLRPVTYKGNDDGDLVFGGLIAEEVHDAGLTEFVQYNEENQPDALAYGNMVSLCIKAIQEQQATIEALTARIAALES